MGASVNEPETGPFPEAVLLFICAQVPGLPPLSGARHSSTCLSPEPPESATVYEILKELPTVRELGDTEKALTVGLVVSTTEVLKLHTLE